MLDSHPLGEDDRLGRVQSLVRAFGMLDELAKMDEGLTLTQIAKMVGLPRSTAHRLLTTMEALRYVEFDNQTNRWSIGIQAFAVGAAFAQTRDLGRLGRPIMRSLSIDAHETVNISVPDTGGIRYVGQVEAMGVHPTLARPGARLPMHTTAAGKALMAHWSAAELDRFLQSTQLDARTRQSITQTAPLIDQLEAVRKRGYALDDQENILGMRCVAAPVFDEHGRPKASLSISGPIARLEIDRLHDLGRTLAAAAEQMTHRIGGRIAA